MLRAGPGDRLFVDTGAWYAAADRRDDRHADAAPFYRTQLARRTRLVTTLLVASEACALVHRRLGFETATDWLTGVCASPLIEIVCPRADDLDAARTLLARYPDQDLTLTDAVSFAVMHRLRLATAFAFDRHFQIAGFAIVP